MTHLMSRPDLKFGLWYSFRNPVQWHEVYVELYQAHLRQIRWAEDIGYDDVWLTEHHVCEDGQAPSIVPLAAAVAAGLEETEEFFRSLIVEGKKLGEIKPRVDPSRAARALLGLLTGLRVLSRSRPEEELLRAVVRQAEDLLG